MRLMQTVEARQQQTQRTDPRQILASEILTWTAPELEEAVERELAENPALEAQEGSDLIGMNACFLATSPTYITVGSLLGRGERQHQPATGLASGEDNPMERLAARPSLHDHLRSQVGQTISGATFMGDEQHKVVTLLRYLIECVDERGYLVADEGDTAERFLAPPEMVGVAVRLLQTMEPPGVGARNLQECLLLQITALEEMNECDGLPRRLVAQFWDDLAAHRHERVAARLRVPVEAVRNAHSLLRQQLTPYPGLQFAVRPGGMLQGGQSAVSAPRIQPDLLFHRTEAGYVVEVARNYAEAIVVVPLWERLARSGDKGRRDATNGVNGIPDPHKADHSRGDTPAHGQEHRHGAGYMGNGNGNRDNHSGNYTGDDAVRRYARDHVERAHMFLKGLERRGQTLYRIGCVLTEWQQGYLETGERAFLRPLTRQALADRLQLDESVISRAVADKWVQLPTMEVVPLETFFGNAQAVREALVRLVEGEDPTHPYSDDVLAVLLNEQGYPLARRTVAKYRGQEKILPMRLRKR